MKTEYKTIKVEIKEGVAVFKIDNPPVNQMSPQLGEDFREAITEAFGDDDVKAIVITGTGKNF
ncbi:MAG: enoyl-CoA hydratase-related protein, partial [Desulfobacteraceae bacterium]|nr:enoyl-CoA hydratase-related protein [Desulfobacteraceae bacterium]